MKKTTAIFLLSTVTAIILYTNLDAQVTRFHGGGENDIVTVDNTPVGVENLFIMDSVKAPHIASFEIELSSINDSRKALVSLLAAAQGNQSVKLTISRLNSQNQVFEERNYKSFIVNEILFTDFNPASKEVAKIKVKIQSFDISVRSDISEPSPQLSFSGKRVLSNNFKMVLGKLPTQRVSGINNIRMGGQGANGYVSFSIEVQRLDSKQWKDWFNTGAGGGRREDGSISLMDPTMANEVASFQLSGVEIMSISESNSSQDAIPKTVIGLRAKKFDLNK